MLKQLEYKEWLALPAVRALPQEPIIEDCPICDGTGWHTCDCGDEHVCGECNGRGKTIEKKSLLSDYKMRLKWEAEAYDCWIYGDKLRQLLIDAEELQIDYSNSPRLILKIMEKL